MHRSIALMLLSATALIALGPLAAAHGGEYTAQGVTEAGNPLGFTLTREPDADPNATVPPGTFATIFTVTLTDLVTGAVVEQATFPGFDNFDGHGATVPWTYAFNVRQEAVGIHFHGSGDVVRGNVFNIGGHFEGPAAVHHGFSAMAVVL